MPTSFTLRPLAAALALGVLSSAALASEADWFLKSDQLKGASVVKDRKGQVDVNGFQWSVTAETSWLKGGGASVGKATPSAFSWNQGWDPSISTIQTDLFTGKAVTSATFEAVRDLGGLKPVVGFSTKVGEVFFTDVHKTLAQGYDVSAVAKNMEFTYNPAAWGGKGKSSKVNWNITANTIDAPVAARAEQVLGNHSAGGDGVTAYLRLGESAGRSTAIGYENWTDVATLEWDVSALSSWLKGGGASVGKPNPGSLSWSQELDGSFLYALTNIAGGKSVPKLVIEYVRNGDHGPVTFMQDVFSDVYFTSIALNDTTVTNSVVFKTVTETTWDINEQGKRGAVLSSFNWDIPGGKVDTKSQPITTSLINFGAGNLLGEPAALPSTGGLPPVGAPVPVPEPGTWALMLAGGLLLALRRRALGGADGDR
jgi:type VI protein secretion system component Hcp